jgi:hypothetical protein
LLLFLPKKSRPAKKFRKNNFLKVRKQKQLLCFNLMSDFGMTGLKSKTLRGSGSNWVGLISS